MVVVAIETFGQWQAIVFSGNHGQAHHVAQI